MNRSMFPTLALTLIGFASTASALAADADFAFKAAYPNVTADPDGVWDASAFSAGKASLYEYELRTAGNALLVSQIWNGDCSAATCPTRLVQLEPDGRRTVLVDDMMRQVIPPNEPRFAGLPKNGPQADFARRPFRLSADGKTLINGDFRFSIRAGKP